MSVYVVRADFRKYAPQFVAGGYAAAGWIHDADLSNVSGEKLYELYKALHPDEKNNNVIGQAVGQIQRFLNMKPGDYVLTPTAEDNQLLHYGRIAADPSYYFDPHSKDGCPYPNRKKVIWDKKTLRRDELSVPFQNTLRSSLTVFEVSQETEFLTVIKAPPKAGPTGGVTEGGTKEKTPVVATTFDPHRQVLDQLLQLDSTEFEFLVQHLLSAIGFEATHKGKVGDKGVDVEGVLDVAGLASIKLVVQVKRWKLDLGRSRGRPRPPQEHHQGRLRCVHHDIGLPTGRPRGRAGPKLPSHRPHQRQAARGPALGALGGHPAGVPHQDRATARARPSVIVPPLDWRSYAVHQRHERTGVHPDWLRDAASCSAKVPGIDLYRFQDDFDLDIGRPEEREDRKQSVSDRVVERYPAVAFDIESFRKKMARRSRVPRTTISRRKAVLASLYNGEEIKHGLPHPVLCLVIEESPTEFLLLSHVDDKGVAHCYKRSKDEVIEQHQKFWPRGKDVACLA